jgi:uncharacterized membrane protein
MMLADVVIDPLAVLGERWFLGHLFYYAEPGLYFGVPLSNFLGWFLVGWVIVGGYLLASGSRPRTLGSPLGGIGIYYGVLLFSLGITAWIGEKALLGAGILVHVGVFLLVCCLKAMSAAGGPADHAPGANRVVATTLTTDK